MSVKELFEDHTHKEIEALFDAWAERDFVDIPTDVFFATLEEIGAHLLRQHPVSSIENLFEVRRV